MNLARRKSIEKAIELLSQAKEVIEHEGNQEQEYYDNMPDAIQESDKGEKTEDAAGALGCSVDAIDEAIEQAKQAIEP